MSDIDNDVINEEEIKKVQEMLSKSRAARLKDKPKKEKSPDKDDKNSSPKNDKFGIICIIAAICSAIAIIVYFVMPYVSTKTIGLTLAEYQENFRNSEVYNSMLKPVSEITFGEVTYTTEDKVTTRASIALTAEENRKSDSNENKNVTYFSEPVTSDLFEAALQGSARNSDNKLASLRAVARIYKPNNLTGSERKEFLNKRMQMVLIYYQACLQSVIPGLSSSDAASMISQAYQSCASGSEEFLQSNGISYRFSFKDSDIDVYFYLDIIPSNG